MKQEQENPADADMARILGDTYSSTILMATNMRSKTALEISHKHGIPIAACYRRINSLLADGFIVKDERYLTQEGKRTWKYLSNVHMVNIMYIEGKMRVRCELRNGYTNDYVKGDDIAEL